MARIVQLPLRSLDQRKSENADLVWATLDENERTEVVLVLARLIVNAVVESLPPDLNGARDE